MTLFVDSYLEKQIIQNFIAVPATVIIVVAFMCTYKSGRERVKKALCVFRDNPVSTLVLSFLMLVMCVFGGSKGGEVVTEKGINLKSVRQTADHVKFDWDVEDDRIKKGATFNVQEYRGEGLWYTMGSTTNHTLTIPKFTVNKHHRWRIMTDITEGD